MVLGAPSFCINQAIAVVLLIVLFAIIGMVLLGFANMADWPWNITLYGSLFSFAAVAMFTYCGSVAWFI